MDDDQAPRPAESFIVKIWIEDTAVPSGNLIWRGYITHVLSGERRYFRALTEIGEFITPYLQEMGVAIQSRLSLAHWLKRRKQPFWDRGKH
ncbi:MAG: hypothetical protein HZB53_06170 [Chloroflexi bacterium]|nr:hypothetical protein [Chloroflexota bacterium]